MLIGYGRVSKREQILDLQLDAFNALGIEEENIFTDKKSGADFEREGLRDALSHVRKGDTFVVWRLDRLGRTLRELIDFIVDLGNRGVGFKSITEGLDTTTANGMLIFHIFGALAEFEKEIIRQRTRAGLDAARARGRLGGRPKIETQDPKKIAMMKTLYSDMDMPVKEICDTLHISKSTLYRYVKPGKTN